MLKIVHVSGYSLLENPKLEGVVSYAQPGAMFGDWDRVCWGWPEAGALGRIPMALWAAEEFATQHIVWSTGASKTKDGVSEAAFMRDVAIESTSRMHSDFSHRFRSPPSAIEVHRKSHIEETSVTTTTSMEALARFVRKERMNEAVIYLVSSANHVMRVLRDAMDVFNYDYGRENVRQRVTLIALPAETCYGHSFAKKVVIKDLG